MKKLPRPQAQESSNERKPSSKPLKGSVESSPNPKVKTPSNKAKHQNAPSLEKRVKKLKDVSGNSSNLTDQLNSKDGGQATFIPQVKESAIDTRIEPPDFGI